MVVKDNVVVWFKVLFLVICCSAFTESTTAVAATTFRSRAFLSLEDTFLSMLPLGDHLPVFHTHPFVWGLRQLVRLFLDFTFAAPLIFCPHHLSIPFYSHFPFH